jgi:hypothetical protein
VGREFIRVFGGKTWRKEIGIPKHRREDNIRKYPKEIG